MLHDQVSAEYQSPSSIKKMYFALLTFWGWFCCCWLLPISMYVAPVCSWCSICAFGLLAYTPHWTQVIPSEWERALRVVCHWVYVSLCGILPWVAPEWLKLSCVSKYNTGYYRSMIFHHLSPMIVVYIDKSCIWILSFKVGYGNTCNVVICIAQVIFTYPVFPHVFRHMIRLIIFSL